MAFEKNAGNDLLSHVLLRSTIGAGGLDFRVRDGNGYDSSAIVTSKKLVDILRYRAQVNVRKKKSVSVYKNYNGVFS